MQSANSTITSVTTPESASFVQLGSLPEAQRADDEEIKVAEAGERA